MAHATREAIEATRDGNGIVRFTDTHVLIEWVRDVPLKADNLVRDNEWLIRPESAREHNFKLYKRLDK